MKVAGIIGAFWGWLGFSAIVGSATYRLSFRVAEVDFANLSLFHWVFVAIFTAFMLYTEGYRGFQKKLCPRFAARAKYLLENPKVFWIVLAPFFCVGYFHATRRRITASFVLTFLIILAVWIVHQFNQPWRGLVDVGVIAGLWYGIVFLCVESYRTLVLGSESADPELPGDSS